MRSGINPIQFDCGKCGAQLLLDGSTRTPTCSYCNTQSLIPDELWEVFHPPALYKPHPVAPRPLAPEPPRSNFLALTIGGVVAVAMIAGAVSVVASRSAAPTPAPPAPRNPIADVGEACAGLQAACTRDGKAQLTCGVDGKLATAESCKGPNGCEVIHGGQSVRCDHTLAEVNDPCTNLDASCSTDHKAELRCVSGHYAVISTCKGVDGCRLAHNKDGDGYTLSCDDHIADVGDPCVDSERTACSSDKKALLTCTAQRFVVHKKCKRGCTTRKLVGTNNTEMSCAN